jgi:hypothetical protein
MGQWHATFLSGYWLFSKKSSAMLNFRERNTISPTRTGNAAEFLSIGIGKGSEGQMAKTHRRGAMQLNQNTD